MFNKMKKGFTLAETLITIGIIGVVAALTLPGVISDYNKKIYATQAKKFYNQLSNAFALTMADKNIDDFHDSRLLRSTENFNSGEVSGTAGDFIRKHFLSQEDCGTLSAAYSYARCSVNGNNYTNLGKSWSGNLNSLVNSYYVGSPSQYYCVISNTGALVCMRPFATHEYTAYVLVDVNGPKQKPNMTGRDLFFFKVSKNGKVSPYDGGYGYSCNTTAAGPNSVCAYELARNSWEMNY